MEEERMSSRKFLSLVGVFLASCLFAWFRPEFVGNGANLFTFWVLLLSIYFGANVTEKYHKIKNGNGAK